MNRKIAIWLTSAVLAATTVLVLSACAGSSSVPAQRNAGNVSADSGDCLLGANNADIEVGIANPTTPCSKWIQDLAGTGLVWYPISQLAAPGSAGNADQETMQQACDLTDGAQELYVEDAGGQDYGDSICSQKEQIGWTPETSPGPLAAQVQQEAQQQAQASASAAAAQASASAAASQAQAVGQAQQSLANDIDTVESDSSTLNNDKSLGSDITTLNQDYATEQSDWSTEQADSCSNVSDDADNVSDDTDNVGDDLDSLQDDITSLQQGAIQSVQTDLSNVQSDLGTLQKLGASPAQSASAAIAGGNKALKSANAAISWATQTGGGIDSDAQALANTAQSYANEHGC